jgi:septum formation protein
MKIVANRSRLILASNSPRRRHLLETAGLEFSVIPSDFDENSVTLPSPESHVKFLAEAKAGEISKRYPECWIIAADTIVSIDQAMLAKPTSPGEARAMLETLSDKTHQVHTGYCIGCKAKNHLFSDCVTTDVTFKNASESEIEWYIASGEPFDKAGAYGIQGIGAFLVKRISGSYTNVVGLPICEVLDYLLKAGIVELDAGDTGPG